MSDSGVLNAFTPIVNSIDRVTSVLPGAEAKPKVTSDQAADVIEAQDTKASVAKDRKAPLWQRLLSHGAAGAVAGGLGLGAKAGLIGGALTGHPWHGAAIGAGVGSLVGGGAGIANELFDRATEKHRLAGARSTMAQASPRLLERLKDPAVKKPARAYTESRGYPTRGVELGAVLGSLGGGAIGALTGHGDLAAREGHAATGALAGMVGVGTAGLLLGSLLKRHRRNQLVTALTTKTASPWLHTNDPNHITETGGNPRKASNRQLMRALAGPPEQYAAGRLVPTGPRRPLPESLSVGRRVVNQGRGSKLAAAVRQAKRSAAADVEKTFWKDTPDGPVYLVNGEDVRNHVDVSFIGGGNSEAYDYVPAGEFWIEDTFSEPDREAFLVHERHEAADMADGDSYDTAHDAANATEKAFRQEKTAFAAPLQKWFGRKVATEAPKLRSRSEVCIYSDKGVLAIKKDGYLLMPGGGIDDGETPELAVAREAIEEADRKILHVKAMGVSECIWPDDVKQVKGFDGSRTYHFMALDGGRIGTEHEDNERFDWIDFWKAQQFLLDECMTREDQTSAKAQNEIRLQCIAEAKAAVADGHTTAVKLANRLDLTVPAQLDDYSCGPACIAGVRAFRGEAAAPQVKLSSELGTNATKGTHPIKISEALGVAGYEGWTPGMLTTALDAGHPVMMLCKDAEADDHYVVAVGYDDAGVAVADPAEPADRMIPWSKLAVVWRSDDIETLTAYGWDIEPTLHVENVKTADALNLADRPEYVLFNHEGKILVAPDANKRYRLPTTGTGKPAPYEPSQRYLPPEGAAEPGVHGYQVKLHVGEGEAPGFDGQWTDPHAVLRNLYGSMGQSVNRPHRELDRARARVILRALKKRPAALAPAVAPVAPSVLTP
jgi:8-oxo-dGTP pyrophosphatase MutT (NUDIX family)/predicted double-glycine peptidase